MILSATGGEADGGEDGLDPVLAPLEEACSEDSEGGDALEEAAEALGKRLAGDLAADPLESE